MRPSLSLDLEIVAANARAWQTFGRAPVYGVVKSDGYGWGLRTMVRALEGLVERFCVADADELEELRSHTKAPAIVLGEVPDEQLHGVLDLNALPSISTVAQLNAAVEWAKAQSRPPVVRVGLKPAAAWSGLSLEALRGFAPQLAAAGALVELWTHIPDLTSGVEQLQLFDAALALLQRAGVQVTGTDVASSFPLAREMSRGAARIGVGLFGATGGADVPGVHCAIRFSAPVLRAERHSPGTRMGYGSTMLGMETAIALLRCGYGDGLPAGLQGRGDTLMVGMQYSAVRNALLKAGATFTWLDRDSSLDEFARLAGRPVHEIVTTLGNCSRASSVKQEV